MLTIVATEVSKRRVDTSSHQSVARSLLVINFLLMSSVILFGLAGSFTWALVGYWLVYFLKEVNGPLYNAWLNQNITSNIRATVFSMSSQSNALGQIILGPLTGLVATLVSLRASLVLAGIVLLPIICLYLFTINKHKLE